MRHFCDNFVEDGKCLCSFFDRPYPRMLCRRPRGAHQCSYGHTRSTGSSRRCKLDILSVWFQDNAICALQIKPELESNTGAVFDKYVAVQYATQVVAGVNYFIKVKALNNNSR